MTKSTIEMLHNQSNDIMVDDENEMVIEEDEVIPHLKLQFL